MPAKVVATLKGAVRLPLVTGATIRVGRCALSSGGEITTQGRVFWLSLPTVGSRSISQTIRPLACRPPARYTLNLMAQCLTSRLDISFAALSDATRRGVLEQLGNGEASITELADKFQMTLTGMKKHVGVLEQAGLVTTQKVGRVRTCTLGRSRLAEEIAWIEDYRRLWASRFDALDQIVEALKQRERFDGHKQPE